MQILHLLDVYIGQSCFDHHDNHSVDDDNGHAYGHHDGDDDDDDNYDWLGDVNDLVLVSMNIFYMFTWRCKVVFEEQIE